jgi:molybdopterin-binding protein
MTKARDLADNAEGTKTKAVDAKGDLMVGTAADTAARLAVGTDTYLLTADNSEVTGLKWAAPAAGGKVLQVVQGTTTTETTIATQTFTDTTITATITPSSASSKIYAIASGTIRLFRGSESDNEQGAKIRLLRGATVIVSNNDQGVVHLRHQPGQIRSNFPFTIIKLDEPATTSATTYKIQGAAITTNQSGTVGFQQDSTFSQITLIEIGA